MPCRLHAGLPKAHSKLRNEPKLEYRTQVATDHTTFTGFPSGVTSGTYLHLFDLTDASSWNPAFITAGGGPTTGAEAALLAGLAANQTYLNVHQFWRRERDSRFSLLRLNPVPSCWRERYLGRVLDPAPQVSLLRPPAG